MDVSELATKKQKHLMEKYKVKYGADYLMAYLKDSFPDAEWETLKKKEAQTIITGRKRHEKMLKEKGENVS